MSEQRLRALKRQADSNPDSLELKAAVLREMLRLGFLKENNVRIAALVGDPVCALVFPDSRPDREMDQEYVYQITINALKRKTQSGFAVFLAKKAFVLFKEIMDDLKMPSLRQAQKSFLEDSVLIKELNDYKFGQNVTAGFKESQYLIHSINSHLFNYTEYSEDGIAVSNALMQLLEFLTSDSYQFDFIYYPESIWQASGEKEEYLPENMLIEFLLLHDR